MKERVNQKDFLTAVAGAFGEWLFAMLPIVVVMLVMANLQKLSHLIYSAEWAFGASVLAGQAIARFVTGVMHARNLSLDRVLLGISLISVVIVVPANIILVLVLLGTEGGTEGEAKPHLSDLLAALQIIIFSLSSITFMLVSIFAHLWTKRNNLTTHNHHQPDDKL